MKLMTLTIRNFQGIESLVLEPNGGPLDIYGDNATGKTTVASALSWLLTGKDALGRGDFAIKPLKDGQEVHNLESLVEGVFENDGRTLILQKVYHEVYEKGRGALNEKHTGHTTDHWINGAPCDTKKQYDDKLASIASVERIKILTDPSFFAESLPMLKRRAVLLDLAGDITVESVIAAHPGLAKLNEVLDGNTVDERRRIAAATKKKINQEDAPLQARIDEAKRAICKPVDTADDEALCDELRTKITGLQEDAARLATGGQTGELQSRIRDAESRLNTAKATMENAARTKAVDDTILANVSRQAALQAVETARTVLSKARAAVPTIEAKHKAAGDEVDRLNAELRTLKAQWVAINAETYPGGTRCPNPECQQELPADRVAAARESWNLSRAEDLKLNVEQGQNTKRALTLAATRFDTLDAELTAARTAVTTAEQTLATAEAAIPAPIVIEPTYADTPDMLAAQADLQAQQTSLANLDIDTPDTTESDRVATELESAQSELKEAEERIAAAKQATKASGEAKTRVEELVAEQTRMGKELLKVNLQLDLLDKFERAQAEAIDGAVNDRFRLARFKLFRELISTGADDEGKPHIEQRCDVLAGDDLAPFNSGLNNGMRIAVGLDIIHTLGQHYGLSLPVIVDNAESVTCLPDIDAQVIRLIVSEADKTLRVEHARASKGVAA